MAKALKFIEKKLSKQHKTTIIWMHGLGDSGYGHESIADEMSFPEGLGVKFILPHAEEIPVTVNGGATMPAWYDILEMNLGRKIDEQGIQDSSNKISDIIQNEIKSGIKPENIILAGFSQGGAVALHTGLNYPVKLGAIIAMSTYLGVPGVLTSSTAHVNMDTPIFWGHGTYDPVVPLSLGQESMESIQNHRFKIDYKEYEMEHSIHPQEIRDIQNWIIKALN